MFAGSQVCIDIKGGGRTLEEWKCFAVHFVILSKLVIKELAASGRFCSMCSRLLPALGFIMIMGY